MADPTFHWRGMVTSRYHINDALLSITNTGSSRSLVRIERLDIVPIAQSSFSASSAVFPPFALKRITSRTEGGQALNVISQSPSASLPSQVKAEVLAHVIFGSNGDFSPRRLVGQDVNNLNFNHIIRLSHMGKVGPLAARGGFVHYGGTNTQGITVREGEGIAVYQTSDLTAGFAGRVMTLSGFAVFSDDLGNSFTAQFDIVPPEAGVRAIFSLFNGSGSGRVYRLLHLEAVPNGDDRQNGSVYRPSRVTFCNTLGDYGGEEVTPTAFDPRSDVPSLLHIKRNRIGYPLGWIRDLDASVARALNLDTGLFGGAGTTPPYGDQQRNVGIMRKAVPAGRANFGIGQAGFQNHNNAERHGFRNKSPNLAPIAIAPGRGFAIVPDNLIYGGIATSGDDPNNRHAYWIELTVSVSTPGVARATA